VSFVFLFFLFLAQGKAGGLRKNFRSKPAGESPRGKNETAETEEPSGRAKKQSSVNSIGRSAIAGFLNPFLYYLVLFKAYSLLPAQEAQPLNFLWPVVLSVLAALVLKEKLRIPSFCALLVSFLGVLIISTRGDVLGFRVANPPGALLAVGSTFIWSTYWLLNMRDDRDEVQKLFLGFFFGFLYIAAARFLIQGLESISDFHGNPFGLILENDNSPGSGRFFPDIDRFGFLGCIYIGLFEMGIAFVLWLKALRLTESTAKISNLIYFAPFLSLVLIHHVVGEEILPSSVIGLVFIVGGVFLQSRVR
jgi:drug/metabolite transporter (DMT)-like permease